MILFIGSILLVMRALRADMAGFCGNGRDDALTRDVSVSSARARRFVALVPWKAKERLTLDLGRLRWCGHFRWRGIVVGWFSDVVFGHRVRPLSLAELEEASAEVSSVCGSSTSGSNAGASGVEDATSGVEAGITDIGGSASGGGPLILDAGALRILRSRRRRFGRTGRRVDRR